LGEKNGHLGAESEEKNRQTSVVSIHSPEILLQRRHPILKKFQIKIIIYLKFHTAFFRIASLPAAQKIAAFLAGGQPLPLS
jgi:hypothetical protein